MWAIVKRIIRERELRLVARAVDRFSQAVEILEQAQAETPDDPEIKFMLGRLRSLLGLTRIGYKMVEGFAEVGLFTLHPIRGILQGLRGVRAASANNG